MGDRSVSLLEVAYQRTGKLRPAANVAAFVIAWATVEDKLGRMPTWPEYSAYWKQSERTTARELARFREAFPEYHTPTDLVADGQPWAPGLFAPAATT